MTTGRVFDIRRYSIHDGPGIRTTVFLKGCPLRCPWCHNPEGQNPDPETIISAMPGGAAGRANRNEIIGKVLGVEEIMEVVEKDILFFDESGGGVTFSGGEPLMQPEFLEGLLSACRERNIHTCLDTSGYASREVFAAVVEQVDLFLYDLKLMDDAQHRKYTGASNRPILNNLRTLGEWGKRVIIRFPVIPEITETEENVSEIIDFIVSLKTIRDISLLPYHTIAAGKYRRLRREEMKGVGPPTDETVKGLRARFERHGISVTVGG